MIRARLTAGATAVAGAVLVAGGPAAAQVAVGWSGSWTLEDGAERTGEQLVVPVTFEYSGSGVITDVTLELVPVDDRCDSRAYTQHLADGDVDSPANSTGDRVDWTFSEDPGCNGVYDVRAFATVDPAGPVGPGDPGTESEPLTAEGVQVSLAPPSPTGVAASAARNRIVTVRWSAPAAWSPTAPADARGYRIERIGPDGAPVAVGEVGADQTSIVDDDLSAAPAGTYRYRVVALRAGATGSPVASAPGESTVEIAAAPAPTTTAARPAPAGRSGGGSTAARSAGRAAVAPPTTEFDPGFSEELDYGDVELGAEEAVAPPDANLFEVVSEDPVGAGVLVPFAVALCLAVWAGHLRHLSRRATAPLT